MPDQPSAPTSEPGAEGDPSVGSSIGRYLLTEALGEGGFGMVYAAEQTEPVRRRVALKVIKPGMDSRAVLARFEAERQALALMDHPHVAKVLDAGATARGLPYFVMEHVAGVPITEYCRLNRLGPADRLELFIQVCEAVQHAHQKGIIHRDLKPSNILVTVQESRPSAKVIDFGIAKALFGPLTERTLYTEHGQLIGTPEYMSPEQARGVADDIDTRADIYSLGAVLYELLTGATPLDSTTLRSRGVAELPRAIEQTEPERPSTRVSRGSTAADPGLAATGERELARQLRGDLDWVVMRCLEKDRTRRYGSAGALADDLRRFLRHQPVAARPPSVGYLAARFVRRHRAAVVGAVVAATVLVLGTAGTSAGLVWALRERARAESEARAAVTARDESETVIAFLADMLESVSPEESGRDVTVREVLDRVAGTLHERFADRPLVEARLRHTIANAYRGLGRYDEADRHLPLALEIRERVLGPDHPETLRVVASLAGLRQEQGRFDEAGRLGRRALDGLTRLGQAGGATAIGARNNLAQMFSSLGRHEEAASLLRQVVEEQRRTMGPDHPHTLGAMVNLASALENLGRPEEAEAMLNEAADAWRRAHGPEHPGTLLALHNLGNLYADTGRAAEGESIFRSIVEARTRVLGPDHPDTIGAVFNLGRTLWRQGRLEEAERYYTRAADDARRVLGPEHPTTLTIVLGLADLYEAMGWPEASAPRTADLVRTLRAVAARPDATAEQLNAGAWVLLMAQPESLRDPAAALEFARRACDVERASGGASLWMYLDTLALALHRTGDSAGAAETQRQAVDALPPHHENYRAEMEARLAEFRAAAGR